MLLSFLALSLAGAQPAPPTRARGHFDPPPGQGIVGDARFLGAVPGRPGRIVRNAAYSGDVVTETNQVLPDGNRIHQTATAHVARDSEGRTRSEQSLRTLGGLVPNGNLPQVVFINDPVSSVNYALNPAAKTATKSAWGSAPMRRPPADAKADPRLPKFRQDGPDPNLKSESLGRQTIEGVAADGTRTTQTIPAGQIGNEQPIQIVSESWYSPELQTFVLSKRSDPRSGETVTRLTNVSRSEPPHSLFEVPSDFRILEAAPRPLRPPNR